MGNLCRLCGVTTEISKRIEKHKFCAELKQLYDIDVANDLHSIHPLFLCHSCRCHLYRSKSENSSSKSKKPRSTPPSRPFKRKMPRLFLPHDENCDLCNEERGGSNNHQQSAMSEILKQFEQLDAEEKKTCVEEILRLYLPLSSLKEHIASISSHFPHKNIDSLRNFDPCQYLASLNPGILGILLSLTGQTKENTPIQTIIPVMESIYRFIEKDFIGIWSFMQNLVTFSCTKSRQACNILGTAIPGGKYSYISAYLNSSENSTEVSCPNGDVVFMFDNEQVIGRTWNITAQNKVKMSVITNIAVVQIPTTSPLQDVEEYSPKTWLTSENQDKVVDEMCENDANESSKPLVDAHYDELYHQLHNAIEHVRQEVHKDEKSGNWEDILDQEIAKETEEENHQTCHNCKAKFGKRARKCPNCQEKVNKNNKETMEGVEGVMADENEEKDEIYFHRHEGRSKDTCNENNVIDPDQQYSHVTSCHSGDPVDVILLDPVFVNPNSIESMILILRYIGKKAGICKYIQEAPKESEYPVEVMDFYLLRWTTTCSGQTSCRGVLCMLNLQRGIPRD